MPQSNRTTHWKIDESPPLISSAHQFVNDFGSAFDFPHPEKGLRINYSFVLFHEDCSRLIYKFEDFLILLR